MKKKISTFMAIVLIIGALISSIAWLDGAVKAAGTGSGTAQDPYIIRTAADLDGVRNDRSAYYKLGADINLGAYTTNWAPIGQPGGGNDFRGSFDGAGHVISGLKVNSTDNFASLFGIIAEGGKVFNLGLTDVQVSGTSYVGGLAGKNSGTVSGSYSVGTVTGTGDYVGGLVGENSYATITESYAEGTVSGANYVGGLAGSNEGYYPEYPLIGESYAVADVTGTGNYVGGVTGNNDGTVRNTYAVGRITGTGNYVGGVLGRNQYMLMESFYASDVAGLNGEGSGNGQPKIAAALKSQITFYGWDFADTWSIREGQSYPKLKKISGAGDEPMAGTGSENDPYIIKTAAQLSSVRFSLNYPKMYFKMNNDIDLSAYSNWEPIKSQANEQFYGVFDGGGHTITGLTIDSALENVGLFGKVKDDSIIRNIRLTGVNVKGPQNVGAFAGTSAAYLVNSYASGTVTLAGNGAERNVGGLVGWQQAGGSVTQNYSDAIVQASGAAADTGVGGLVGRLEGQIYSGYANGSVTADAGYAGGLVGKGNGTISYGYAIGQVNAGGGTAGGLVGDRSQIYVNSSYYDQATTGQSDTGKGTPRTTMQMKTQSTFSDWDFNNTWFIRPDNYPKLRAFLTTYTVTYNGNGSTAGTAPTDTKQYEAGETATVMAKPSNLTRSGYSFEGWNTAADGSGTTYKAGDTITIAGGVKLYAQWKLIPTYTIGALDNLTMADLAAGYLAGMQETKTVTIIRTGTGDLTNVAANLSGAGASGFEIVGPASTTLNAGTPSTTFTVRAKNALPAGTYTATVTVSADNMVSQTFTVKQIVQAKQTVLKGDGNGDGLVTPADALLITKYMAGKLTLTAEQIEALDMNGDGKLDNTDVQMIMAIYLGGQ